MLLLSILGSLVVLVIAQESIQNPLESFCRRYQHQTCVIDSKLYVDGGLAYYGKSVAASSHPERNTWLLWNDLSSLSSGLPPQYKNLTKGPDIPTVSGGVLWPDRVNKLFYLFGGAYDLGSQVKDFTNLWFFDTIYNTWNKTEYDGSQADVAYPYFGASTVTDEGIAYYYGGYLSKSSVLNWQGDKMMLRGLLSYDMNKNLWKNRTYDPIRRAEGSLQYLPASDRGMLVYIGGLETSISGVVNYQIQLFDLSINKWYTQTATGNVPQARRSFCSGVVWAEDYSSYSIYIYGGIGSKDTALGDLHVLSIPSFTWSSLYPDPQVKDFPGGKAWSSCNVIQNSQMIVMGGDWTNPSKIACDVPDGWGQHGVLLGQEGFELPGNNKWWSGLKSNISTYNVPGNIVSVIGGGPEGKATATAPAAGWQTSDLANYFRTTYAANQRSATRLVPGSSSSTSTAQSNPTDPPSKTSVGAIAGGVVGGVVGLVCVIALAWCCLRHRHRQTPGSQTTPHVSSDARGLQQDSAAAANEKYIATPTTASYPSTFPSPHPHMPTYSPQVSPPPPSWSELHTPSTHYEGSPPMPQQAWASYDMPVQYVNQQQYYPPPTELSQTPSKHAHMASAELPSIRSPANEVAEMPEIRSPVPKRGL
ncbi:uncharacterized protein M421DRAFT_98183 [Didymella exigua CBS 183.55]|uniref:Galactose oxidase n=1 Tax=Didymella exigua CBS 183.55 TaxID=1150837 RepID=A0A6A5S155_9PLEO|nr:uncharacterized protein M421DRAFT_98183 [Didymella exigua CBS 183.55]KAF1933018.1 hypothetical protein M421DRAFT_98183 [Didymella exigua CBS 183.55]